jgi:hypothetical protein
VKYSCVRELDIRAGAVGKQQCQKELLCGVEASMRFLLGELVVWLTGLLPGKGR